MADWFIGSASKLLDAPSATWVHTIGFRSETALMALVVCDIDDVRSIDRQSVRMHINLHPIEAVDVILVASGVRTALTWDMCDNGTQHTLIHRIVDCIIDALTFGCPAMMRITPHALQWRKFDAHPIATLTRHTPPIDPATRTQLTAVCGDPTLATSSAFPLATRDISNDLLQAPAQPVTHVQWQQYDTAWKLTINTLVVVITSGRLVVSPITAVWCLCTAPHHVQQLDDTLVHLLGVQP